MQKNLKAAILAALLAAPAVSFAQEAEESNFSWNAGVVSDYVFRGISQSNQSIAFQGGIDYGFAETGFYTGAWWSTVDFGANEAKNEVDFYVGYNTDLGDKFNFDVMFTRYTYHGGVSEFDYNELISKLALKDVATLTLGYTNDFSNSGENATYVNLGQSWDLSNDFSLSASFGRSYFEGDDYNDWNVGVTKSFDIGDISLIYNDTNLPIRASDSIVLSLKINP